MTDRQTNRQIDRQTKLWYLQHDLVQLQDVGVGAKSAHGLNLPQVVDLFNTENKSHVYIVKIVNKIYFEIKTKYST